MKTLKYSFKCDENPMKMATADQGVTRHCNTCERNIVDFTKMRPEQIAAFVTGNKKPCGFIHPSQIAEVNAYLKRTHVKPSLVSKWAKIAAIAASPLLFSQAFAQEKVNKPEIVSAVNTTLEHTEVLVADQNGLPLAGLEVQVYSGTKRVGALTTDDAGKIYLYHKLMPNPVINLANEQYGISMKLNLAGAGVCYTWNTGLDATAINVSETELDFKFTYRDDHNKPVRNTEVEITFFDDIYHAIKQENVKTDNRGHVKIKIEHIEKIATVNYIVKTGNGEKWASSYELKKDQANLVEINKNYVEQISAGVMAVDY